MKNINKKTVLAFTLGAIATSGVGIAAVSFASDANKNNEDQCRCPMMNREFDFHGMKNMQEEMTVGKVVSIDGNSITIESIKMERPDFKQFKEEETEENKEEKTFETITYTIDVTNSKIVKTSFDSETKKPTETELTISDIAVGNYISVKGEKAENNIVTEEVRVEEEKTKKDFNMPWLNNNSEENKDVKNFGRRGFGKMKMPSQEKTEVQEN